MFPQQTTYIGIDPAIGRRPFTYAAIDSAGHVLARSHADLNDLLAFIGGQRQAVVAIAAPQRPNQGLMEQLEVRQRFTPLPRGGRWSKMRVAEYALRQHGINGLQTPASEEAAPAWMRAGFELYHRLHGLGYEAFLSGTALRWLEVYAPACYCAWIGRKPLPKTTLEGRLQRQLVLYETRLRIPDPMDFFEEITRHRLRQGILPLDSLYDPASLDALAAALTAWMMAEKPEDTSWLGDPDEGLIAIPAKELKPSY